MNGYVGSKVVRGDDVRDGPVRADRRQPSGQIAVPLSVCCPH